MREKVTSILGQKIRMTQIFDDDGRRVPVTVIQAGPCPVLQVKTAENDGYDALQVGFGPRRRGVSKALAGHAKRSDRPAPRWIREVPHPGGEIGPGSEITLEAFGDVRKVDISGVTKGRGYAGTIKRWGFTRGPVTHGSKNVRQPGSTGQGTDPGKVFKGKKMAGRYGGESRTVSNLDVVRVEKDRNLLFVRGAVPGPSGGVLMIRASRRG
jgi:large subunit ribosomal protein L3